MPRLTNAIARDAKPRSATYDIADDALAGFCLRVTPTGSRTWGLRYRMRDGKSRRMSLGSLETRGIDDARRLAKQVLGRVAEGEDPQQNGLFSLRASISRSPSSTTSSRSSPKLSHGRRHGRRDESCTQSRSHKLQETNLVMASKNST